MISFPWDSIVERMEDGYPIYDRAYSAQQWWDIYKTFFSNGVFATPTRQFEVSADMGMLLQVMPGYCNINGCFGTEKSTRNVAINLGRNLPRIDTVVLRFDANVEARSIELFVIEGEESESPKRPALTRTETVYELGIADVYVGTNATSLSDTNITDTRAEVARCGYVNPLFNVDTTGWFNQVQQTLEEMSGELKKQTDTAVQLAKDILEGTVESAFQNQLNKLEDRQDKFNDLTTGLNLLVGTRDYREGKIASENIVPYYTDGFRRPSAADRYEVTKDEDGFSVFTFFSNKLTSGAVGQTASPVTYIGDQDGDYTAFFEIKIDDVSLYKAGSFGFVRQYTDKNSIVKNDYIREDVNGLPASEFQSGKWYTVKVKTTVTPGTSVKYLVLFTEIPFGTTTNIHYRQFGIFKGDINNPIWSPSPADLVLEPNNDITTGINLLQGTRDFILGSKAAITGGGGQYYSDGWRLFNANAITISKDNDGYSIATIKGDTSGAKQMASSVVENVSFGDVFTAVFDVKIDDPDNIKSDRISSFLTIKKSGGSQNTATLLRISDIERKFGKFEKGKWKRIWYTITVENSTEELACVLFFYTTSNDVISFRKASIIRGDIHNPVWSPSPFDNMNSSADLFSGTLPLTKGGTGLTSSPSMLVNLASTSAQNVLQSQPRPGVNGVLQPANGGTGQSSLQATRNAMGLGNTLGALPVDKGGTGATDAATARKNLGVEQISALSAWPVGSIYLSSDPTSPGELFGGTWTQLPTGKVLQTGASFQAGGSTSTSANHSHSLGSAYGKFEMNVDNPKRMYYTWKNSPSYSANYYMNITDTIYSGGKSLSTGMEIGGSTSNAETTAGYPYQNVYAWRRTK